MSYQKSISKTVHEGGDFNVSCKYPQLFRSETKFVCKGLQPASCPYKESVKDSKKTLNVRKYFLYDDRTKQIFTVSIRNVTEQDSGEYWCGAEAAWTSDHGYKVYFTQINLIVTDSPQFQPQYLHNLHHFCLHHHHHHHHHCMYSSFSFRRIFNFHCDQCRCNSAATSDWNLSPACDSTKRTKDERFLPLSVSMRKLKTPDDFLPQTLDFPPFTLLLNYTQSNYANTELPASDCDPIVYYTV
ncbi:uncharacterized protein LOC124387813 [Silurus meridionalis]|uniref:uncharacterized protein LOC124387813 n=1 Tax=Silurus meridionalis TaxID=175797 RepID=UPI001EE9E10D|nr:uncharacterized protein LOC124387813 [Silurus meridionalis]